MKQTKRSSKKSDISRNYGNKLLSASSPFAITESFKKIRTNILFSTSNIKCPVIGVTSAFQKTGKSLISSNLGISFSQLNKKVLIIDCDLRKPVQHKIFDVENDSGISNILAGMSETDVSVIKLFDYENLFLITSGSIPPNPSELLASEKMSKLLSAFKQTFDIIIIDLPPINMVTDAAVISKIVDGYLFIIRMEHDDTRWVQEAMFSLEQAKAKIFGIILNDVNPKRGKYYKNYNKYGKHYSKYKYYKYTYEHGYREEEDE